MAFREAQMKYIYISKKFGQGPSNLISDVFSTQSEPNCKTIFGRGFSPAFLPQAPLYQQEDCSPYRQSPLSPPHLLTALQNPPHVGNIIRS